MIQKFIYVILLFIILGEVYTCHLIYKFTKKRSVVFAYLLLLVTIIASLFLYFKGSDQSKGQTAESMHVMALLLLFLLPKILISIPLFFEDMFRFTRWTSNKFIYKKIITNSRSSLLTKIVLTAAGLLTLSIIYGVFVGKYNFKVREETIAFKDLPADFDGLKVLQISDLHVGSWDNKEAIEKGIEMINAQEYDILLFTGDFVNTLATEADPWIAALQKIKTPKYGKFAVLGNHDYGEYVKWDTEAAKEANFVAIKNNIEKSGFKLLLNENVVLKSNNDSIYLLGVENWGLNFKKAGDLKKTSENVPTDAFKIVMTHDPSHWDAEIVNHQQKYQLTLSGHTHGMQFGFDIPSVLEWSPAEYIYPEWGGLYNKGHQYIYVNRGFGFHAYSGRVGIWPEITVLELKKSK
ncbi:metallophosphoesterase [Paenimyroides baculatum]|uniref:Metallophosphoesterase n=1 Tax=Paenimyroides baculatum TaxID=2608000 RepID=A0A5M6CCG7_9FLAO|nr:metallophosphoesterase [Paenimyroides baculatum]KAA5532844.1 metallophosphoesterase [Paenimyroides baculatum]